jgi:hypothetical protein
MARHGKSYPSLGASDHITVSAAERQNNLVGRVIDLRETRKGNSEVSAAYVARNAFSSPMPKSRTCSALPVQAFLHRYDAIT